MSEGPVPADGSPATVAAGFGCSAASIARSASAHAGASPAARRRCRGRQHESCRSGAAASRRSSYAPKPGGCAMRRSRTTETPSTRAMVVMGNAARCALVNSKTRWGSSPAQIRPPPLPRCRAPGAGGGSHGVASSASLARGKSRRHPCEPCRRAQPVGPSSRSTAPSARTRAKAPRAFAPIGPTPPATAGTPAGRAT